MIHVNDSIDNFSLNRIVILVCFIAISHITWAQKHTADTSRSWEASACINNNFLSDQYMIGLNGTFDRDWLHTEVRYNSEDFHTVSLWGGYNFSGGNKLTYTFTPMLGFMFGKYYGLLPGVGIELDYGKWSYTTEIALVVYSSSSHEESYIYSSGEIDYSIDEMFYVGISVNRSKIYSNPVSLQSGFGGGFTKGKLAASGYIYDLFYNDPFGFVSITYNF